MRTEEEDERNPAIINCTLGILGSAIHQVAGLLTQYQHITPPTSMGGTSSTSRGVIGDGGNGSGGRSRGGWSHTREGEGW